MLDRHIEQTLIVLDKRQIRQKILICDKQKLLSLAGLELQRYAFLVYFVVFDYWG